MSDNGKIARRPSEPPLEREEWAKTDPESGTKVRVVRNRRGILATETTHFESLSVAMNELARPIRPQLEELCDHIRDQLDKRGLPSDRTPTWIRIGEGEWEPDRPEVHREPPFSRAVWTKRLEQLTEPLSKERTAGKLLSALLSLLERKGIESHLWDVTQVMTAYRTYSIAGSVNCLAATGMAARRARAAGPVARRQRANKTRSIICERAKAYWAINPLRRGDASNTAATIASAVNDKLLAEGLLPMSRKGLRVKTISDHIRAGLRGQII